MNLTMPNCFHGQVTDTVFLGNTSDVGIASDIGAIRAQPSPPGDTAAGLPVCLKIDPGAIVLLRRDPAAGNT